MDQPEKESRALLHHAPWASAGGCWGLRKSQNRGIASGMKDDDIVVWTAVSYPWHRIRRGAVGVIVAALCAYGSWIVARQVPAMLSNVVRLPPIVRAEAPQEQTFVHEPPPAVQPVATKLQPPRGPVVRNVPD